MTENMKIDLHDLGWNENYEDKFANFKDSYKVGRVAIEHKNMYRVLTQDGEILATISGKMKHTALGREDYPAVGDWVVIDKTVQKEGNAIIHDILPRKSKFSRKVAGNQTDEQIIAVNVDTVFLCTSLNKDLNVRRLERYLIMAWESGANPVIILTKSDLCEDVEEKIAEVESVAMGVNIHVLSSKTGEGLESISGYVNHGETVAFLGSSGVGKSTLINTLIGEERLATKEVRDDDDKGKHTTTHRELLMLPEGGIVIDTPGMREFHILDTEEGLGSTFGDVEELAARCKFNDCTHLREPGCAVQQAIEEGTLPRERFDSYLKLKREAAYLARKNNKKEAMLYNSKMKSYYKKNNTQKRKSKN